MRRFLFALAFLAASSVQAADRTEKIHALMEAQGLVATFDQQIQAGRLQAKANAKQMLDQLLAGLSPNDAFQEKFRLAVDDFAQQLQPPWSAKQVVDVWAGIYGAQFTDAELDGLLAWYTSPLAQKEVAASRDSLVKFRLHREAEGHCG